LAVRIAIAGKTYAKTVELLAVYDWLKTKNYWNLDEIIIHIDVNYGVVEKQGETRKFIRVNHKC